MGQGCAFTGDGCGWSFALPFWFELIDDSATFSSCWLCACGWDLNLLVYSSPFETKLRRTIKRALIAWWMRAVNKPSRSITLLYHLSFLFSESRWIWSLWRQGVSLSSQYRLWKVVGAGSSSIENNKKRDQSSKARADDVCCQNGMAKDWVLRGLMYDPFWYDVITALWHSTKRLVRWLYHSSALRLVDFYVVAGGIK